MALVGLNFKTIRLGSCLYDQWLKEKSSFEEQLNAVRYDGELLSSEVSAGDFLDHLLDLHRRMCRVCSPVTILNQRGDLPTQQQVIDLRPSQIDHSPGSGNSAHPLSDSDVRSPTIQHDSQLIGHSKTGEITCTLSSEEEGATECLTGAGTPTREIVSLAHREADQMETSLADHLDEDDGTVLASSIVKTEHAWDQDVMSKERSCQAEENQNSTPTPELRHSHAAPWASGTASDPLHVLSHVSAELRTSPAMPDSLTFRDNSEGLPAEDGDSLTFRDHSEGLQAEDGGNVSHRGPRFSCWDCGQIFEDVANLQQHCAHSSCHRQRALLNLCHGNSTHLSSVAGDARDAVVEVSSDSEPLQDDDQSRQQPASHSNGLACNICGKVFAHRISFNIHMNVHKSTDAHVCQACGRTFSSRGNLEQHVLTHYGCQNFPCLACSKKFKYRNSLYKHVMTKHANTQYASGFRAVCLTELSSVAETTQTSQWPHLAEPARHHRENCPSLGSSATEMFSETADLQRQPSSLDADRPASPAPHTLLSEWNVEQHKTTNERRMHRHTCDICKKVFSQSNNLKRHRRIHTNERPYKCNICLRGFAQSNTLKEHKHIHSTHKGYGCNACGKCFRQRSSMDKHKKNNTTHGIVECSLCGVRFANKCTLRVHMASHMIQVV